MKEEARVMINLSIEIELNGKSVPVGKIAGTDHTNAQFYYLDITAMLGEACLFL